MSGMNSDGVGYFFVDNLKRYLNGEPLQGLVNRDSGY
jgi:hypothetical protein